jgi:hypothetical protein
MCGALDHELEFVPCNFEASDKLPSEFLFSCRKGADWLLRALALRVACIVMLQAFCDVRSIVALP